jgi:hypothetical protein
MQAGEAELGGQLGEAPVGGQAALAGAAKPPRWWGQAGVVEQAAGNHGGDVELAGQLFEAGVLVAARCEVAGKVGETQSDDAVVQALLLGVDYGEAAADGEPAVRWC